MGLALVHFQKYWLLIDHFIFVCLLQIQLKIQINSHLVGPSEPRPLDTKEGLIGNSVVDTDNCLCLFLPLGMDEVGGGGGGTHKMPFLGGAIDPGGGIITPVESK